MYLAIVSKMLAGGKWLAIGPKIERGSEEEENAVRDIDTKLLTKIRYAYEFERLMNPESIKPIEKRMLLDPAAIYPFDQMLKRAKNVFVIKFEKNDECSILQAERAKKWQQTFLARAIAAGLKKTAVYLQDLQNTMPESETTLAPDAIIEVLLHCFPQDEIRPVQVVAAIFKALDISTEKAMQMFGRTLVYRFGQPLVTLVQQALKDELDDTPLSKRAQTPLPKGSIASFLPIVVTVDRTTLPKGSQLPPNLRVGDFFYKMSVAPIDGNWVVAAIVGTSIVTLIEMRGAEENKLVRVAYLVYRKNPFGKVWHVLANIADRLYDADSLFYDQNLHAMFMADWRWNGATMHPRTSTSNTIDGTVLDSVYARHDDTGK